MFKILRILFVVLLFVGGVFIGIANTDVVDLKLWTNLESLGVPDPPTLRAPLFIVILVSVVLGLLLGSIGAMIEQGRLRLGLRRANKTAKKAEDALAAVQGELEIEKGESAKQAAAAEAAENEAADLRRQLQQLEAEVGDDSESTDGDADTETEERPAS